MQTDKNRLRDRHLRVVLNNIVIYHPRLTCMFLEQKIQWSNINIQRMHKLT